MFEKIHTDPMMEKPFSAHELYNTDLITGELRDAVLLGLRSVTHIDSRISIDQNEKNSARITALTEGNIAIVSTAWSWDEYPSIYAVYHADDWDYVLHKGSPGCMGFVGFGECHGRPNTQLVIDDQSKRISRLDVLSADGFLYTGTVSDVSENGAMLQSKLLISQLPVVACVVFVDCVGIGQDGIRYTGVHIHA